MDVIRNREGKSVDILKIEAEIGKLMAETIRLGVEGQRLRRGAALQPLVAATSFLSGVVAAIHLFHP